MKRYKYFIKCGEGKWEEIARSLYLRTSNHFRIDPKFFKEFKISRVAPSAMAASKG